MMKTARHEGTMPILLVAGVGGGSRHLLRRDAAVMPMRGAAMLDGLPRVAKACRLLFDEKAARRL